MAAIKTLYQGDSLSIGFSFGTYDVSRIENAYVYINEQLYPSSLEGSILRCVLKSEDTKRLYGTLPLMVVIDDSIFGIRKTIVGNISFISSSTINDVSINQGYNISVTMTINEESTAVCVELIEAFRGLSAYDYYVKYTTDDPVLTESEWNDAYNDLVSYKIAAEAARNEAEGFAGDAEDSAGEALISEQNAKGSELAAEGFKNTAGQQATISTDKALESFNSAAAALVSEQHAKTSEDNAKGSETASGISASNAAGSAITAGQQAGIATNKASEALGYRNEAEGFAGEAEDAKNIALATTEYMGGIAYDAPAPTPAKNCWYEFTSAGVCSWLGGASVVIGDRAIVVYDTTYTYTYQANPNTNIEQVRSQATNKVASSKLLDDELTALAGDVHNELYERTINLFDKTKVTDGVYLIGTGATGVNADYYTSDYIQIVAGKSYITNQTFTFIEQFDNNKNFIPYTYSAGDGQKTFTAVQDGFVRISEFKAAAPLATMQIEEGTVSTPYQAYEITKYTPLAEFNKVKDVSDAIDVSFSGTYGELDISETLPSYFGGTLTETMSTINSRANKSGYLNNFKVLVNSSGVLKIVIGLLDQNMRVINQRSESIDVVAGTNTLNLVNRRIFIDEGEQVFLLSADLVSKFAWGTNATTNSRELIFGDINGILGKYPSTYGGKVALSWDIMEVDSVFAENYKLESIQNAVKSQSSIISNVGVVIDRVSGAKYKQVVVGGQLQLIPMQYKKVLIMGNSLTNHPILTSIGWYGDEWAMAASTRENSWDYLLQRILAQKEPTATVTTVNIVSWEQNPISVDLSTLLDAYLVAGVDCVIFKAGENGAYTSDYLNGVNRLVEYIITKLPSADILMTSMFWPTTDKELAISQSSAKYGLTYISTQSTGLNRCNMGDYLKGSDGLLHPITNSGVAFHMNDVGFYLWTNILADALGYTKLNELYAISVVDAGAIGYTCPTQWVKGGIVSVHTTATTVTVVDANSNAITITDHADGVFTFIMPNTSVTVTIL